MNECLHIEEQMVRARGSRVRMQCKNCLRVGPWQVKPAVTNHPDHVINEIPEVEEIEDGHMDYDSMTVPQLRMRAKEFGFTGYSKWNKTQLIEALSSNVLGR